MDDRKWFFTVEVIASHNSQDGFKVNGFQTSARRIMNVEEIEFQTETESFLATMLVGSLQNLACRATEIAANAEQCQGSVEKIGNGPSDQFEERPNLFPLSDVWEL